MKLVIFDLDQTLVDFLPWHDKATRKLFKELFGVDAKLSETDFAGRSLMENFTALARLKNVPQEVFGAKSRQLIGAYERIFIRHLPRDATGLVLPGARELLDGLSRTDNLVALYTGNSPGIVKRVLLASGLARYFRFCLSGTEVKTRADMVRQAIAKGGEMTSRKFIGKEIVIVGDSLRDIECGKQFDALTVAVATGFHSERELSEYKPDYLFKSLEDYPAVLEAIG